MLGGSVVIYGRAGPLAHILAGTPGKLIRPGVVEFHGVPRPVDREHITPARLWVRRGRESWRGPLVSWRATKAALTALYGDRGEIANGLEPGRSSPMGAEIVSGGWRYRLAWAGDRPPS